MSNNLILIPEVAALRQLINTCMHFLLTMLLRLKVSSYTMDHENKIDLFWSRLLPHPLLLAHVKVRLELDIFAPGCQCVLSCRYNICQRRCYEAGTASLLSCDSFINFSSLEHHLIMDGLFFLVEPVSGEVVARMLDKRLS